MNSEEYRAKMVQIALKLGSLYDVRNKIGRKAFFAYVLELAKEADKIYREYARGYVAT